MGHPVRLKILSFVVQAGPDGSAAGDIQSHVDLLAAAADDESAELVTVDKPKEIYERGMLAPSFIAYLLCRLRRGLPPLCLSATCNVPLLRLTDPPDPNHTEVH